VPAKLLEALEALQLQRPGGEQQPGGEPEPVDAAEAARRKFDQQAELDARREGDPDFSFEGVDGAGALPEGLPDVLCARCFSLKHTGKVKNLAAEGALPDFDLGRKVRAAGTLLAAHAAGACGAAGCWPLGAPGPAPPRPPPDPRSSGPLTSTTAQRSAAQRSTELSTAPHCTNPPPPQVGTKIRLQKDRRALVLCVVDVWDFDGSLPRAALKSLLPPGLDLGAAPPAPGARGERAGPGAPPAADLGFKLMVAVNKFDLLPSQATATRVEQWVRIRMRQAGLPKPDKVFMVGGWA
jgi:hypothetical protein